MLPRHKKARSDMKSAEKKLRDAQTKYMKTKEALGKAQKGVASAKARLAAAAGAVGVLSLDSNGAFKRQRTVSKV